MERILLTGFEPFHKSMLNPSQEDYQKNLSPLSRSKRSIAGHIWRGVAEVNFID